MQNLFREIHKNSWLLKKADAKKVLQKKSEKYWVVFCVHDDCEAFLEGFTEPRSASTHQPDWSIALQTTQHVSHALVSSEQEFEFVVTLASEIARFSAPTWELMIEWVECLRSKLREMKILSPRENLYSKLPEIRPPLLPTRDPTSPLPAPPPVAVNLIPGVERVIHPPLVASASLPTTSAAAPVTTTLAPQPSTSTASMSNTSIQNIMNLLSNPLSAVSKALHHSSSSNSDGSSTISSVSSADLAVASVSSSNATHPEPEGQSLAKTFTNNVLAELHEFPSTSGCSLFQLDANADLDCSSNESNSITIQAEPLVIPRPHTSRTSELKCKPASNSKKPTPKIQKPDIPVTEPHLSEEQNDGSTNITIIQVSNIDLSSTESPKPAHNSDDYKSNVQIIPSNISPPPPDDRNASPTRTKVISISGENSVNRVQVNDYGKINISKPSKTVIISTTAAAPSAITTVVENSTNKTKTNISITQNPTAHYEEVFLSTSAQPANGVLLQHPPITSYPNHIQRHNVVNSNNLVNIVNTNQSIPVAVSPTTRFLNKQQRSTSQPQMQVNNRLKLFQSNNVISISSGGDKENTAVDELSQAQPAQEPSTSTTQVNSKTEAIPYETAAPPTSASRPMLQRGQTEVVINRTKLERTARSSRQRTANNSDLEKLRTNGEAEDSRKRSSSTSDAASNRNQATSAESPRRLQQPPQPYRPENSQSNPSASGRMTLREQQVFQLRREMMHPGGVRLQLRRKDCLGSIAWVEAFGGVWVAGWKQREHPVLYNALHIGDQLISIAGTPVSTPAEANKIIRAAPGLFVEMLIRRVPFGRVYAIRREMEAQCLGLIRDGNSAIIVDVVPNSLAARFGLPPKAQTCDKTSLTFWVLTEINFRPLNLFFKENEIKDRLNCVGRDISILVQPSDLVTKLKKQLKSTIKGHKDFIVQ